jgi:diguanylate cyclase (GGDEF)-like protein
LHAIAVSEMAPGLCLLDADLRIVLFNRHFIEALGLPSREVRLGTPLRALLGRSARQATAAGAAGAEMWSELERMLACGEPFHLHRRFHKGPLVAFHFRPTAGGGWVATCEQLSEHAPQGMHSKAECLHRVMEHVSHGLCVLDAEQRLVVCNEQYLRIYGFDRGDIRPGMTFREILEHTVRIGTHADVTVDELYRERSELFQKVEAVRRHWLSDGRVIEMRVRPVEGGGWVVEHKDITRQVRYEQALQDRNRLLDAALDHMAHGLCAFDADLRVIVVNRRYLDIYGLTVDEARPGTSLLELMRRSIARGIHCMGVEAEQMYADFKQRLIDNREPVLHRRLADGRVIAVRHQPMAGGGWVGTYEDITERHRAEESVARMARHDALTDLPNRLLFTEKMAGGLARVVNNNEAMAVMCLDLDNFKAVNDSLGHPFGDKLLQGVAKRLCKVIGESDTIARLGGDEFAVLHPVADARDAEEFARRLIDSVANPFLIEGQEINSGISIGIAIAPDNGTTGDQLMKCADLALYRAKAHGRNTYRFFEPEMDIRVRARRALEIDLRRGLTAGEFHLVYQPQINLATRKIVGMEALLRWTHPGRGPISPGEFIPVAEETGLIIPLGEWVLRQACTEAARWPSTVKLAVNLSPVQFRNRTLITTVTHALAASRLPADRLELEITEAVLMQDDKAIVGMLHQLRGLGVRIAMDDFGTGYSSLSYLRSFPFDKLKIDQSFIADVGSNTDSVAIIRTIAELGTTLGIETTAEGIETIAQLELVQRAGCTEGQGYLIGRPCPAAEVPEFIRQFRRTAA